MNVMQISLIYNEREQKKEKGNVSKINEKTKENQPMKMKMKMKTC